MIYVIEAFDKKTELLAFEEELPNGYEKELKAIMGWKADQQGWEGYNLTNEQLNSLEEILGKKIYNPSFLFQLTCNV
ncbi:hypothetical protein HNR03_001236 [Pseudomonas sp. JAI111]|uniref:DUF7683 domain-containing protein n=1 Tax=unclassified Pseudomonas TaxID=196821 RepID=UPI001C98F5ED|nr:MULTISPECIES: hypothetical protein [unclassified Pseudomonas]MCS3836656.1 hypothetical protein [Pseudomonas sp. JAI111]QZP35636.1 hypothetical protein K5K95_15015 [Pseudomonas sp. DR48]